MELFSLTEQKVLICGASRGIGRATALLMAQLGARLILVARAAEDLEALVAELPGDNAGHIMIPGDLTQPADQDRILAVIQARGTPDVVIANINSARPYRYLANLDRQADEDAVAPDEHRSERFLAGDLTAENTSYLLRFMPAILRGQRERGYGRWVAISSMIARRGGPGQALYAAQKSALEALMRGIALEEGRRGITANVVAPGLIDTPTARRIPAFARIAKMNALGRAGAAEEVAAAVAFLAGPAAAYITGVTLPVCGGYDLSWELLDV